jgi:GntR family transcriptional regulator, galactonate operon transcriptional repressor
MATQFARLKQRTNLHDLVVRQLALSLIEAERASEPIVFPNEAGLCRQLGVSRTVLRESMKVLADKGMVARRPRGGTRARPRSEWRLLDADILAWQAEIDPDPRFLRDLCEVRLAIEPTAASFAALRASPEELKAIERCLERREAKIEAASFDEIVDLDLEFHTAIVTASHNSLFVQLDTIMRHPFRSALCCTSRLPDTLALGLEAYRNLGAALHRRDPLAARNASEQIVGVAMLAVEQVVGSSGQK